MYSAYNGRKHVVAERFTRILKFTKIWLQYQKMCFDKLDDKVNKHNNT